MKQKEAYNLSNLSGDYTRSQYNLAFTNAKNALRRNAPADANLRGRKLREAAQQMVINAWRKTPDLGDVQVADEPTDAIDAQIARENIMNKYENLHRFENEEPIAVPLMTPRVFGNYTQADLDKMSFNDAFGAARKAGQKNFTWRVGQNARNKSGVYGTKLASEVTPPRGQGGNPVIKTDVNQSPYVAAPTEDTAFDAQEYYNKRFENLQDALPGMRMPDPPTYTNPSTSWGYKFWRNGRVYNTWSPDESYAAWDITPDQTYSDYVELGRNMRSTASNNWRARRYENIAKSLVPTSSDPDIYTDPSHRHVYYKTSTGVFTPWTGIYGAGPDAVAKLKQEWEDRVASYYKN